MEDSDSLTRLRGLQADLEAFSESRLQNIDRLWAELQESLGDFRKLLDKQQKNEGSRKQLQNDKITVDEVDYAINEEFRQEAIQVAEELDLDELDAARLVLETQSESADLGRPVAFGAIIHFHDEREATLLALSSLFQRACDTDLDENRGNIQNAVDMIIRDDVDKPPSRSYYWRRCIKGMEDIEGWIKRTRDRMASIQVIGETSAYVGLILNHQRGSLVRQHESLAIIARSLVNLGHTTIDDYRLLTTKVAAQDSFDEIAVHYVPLLLEFPSIFGSEGQASLRDVRSMDQTFSDKTDTTRWKLPDFKGAATIFWLAEYSGRYADGITGSPLQNIDLDKENQSRSDRAMDALQDGAFQFVLLVCSKIKKQLWHDPAKTGLVQFLLADSRLERDAYLVVTDAFSKLLLNQLQVFVESLISNMPDTIRRLKAEEDDQRRNFILSQGEQELTLHLERFMTIIGYAYEGSPVEAYETFWEDPESNMHGFLQWSSKRQSTPRAASFCEMFRSIAEDEKCAKKAHLFLLEESMGAKGTKLQRGTSLCWDLIFSELSYYADRMRESASTLTAYNEGPAAQISEPESALMLECYLRLTAHMCRNSAVVRDFILSHAEFRLHEVLFDLCRSGIETRFKACAFNTLASLLTDKTIDVSYGMWTAVDEWICGTSTKSAPSKPSNQPTSDSTMLTRLRAIAVGFEEPNAFVRFLQTLVELPIDQQELNDSLPFPEQLGVNYRMSGIGQYIDFIFGTIVTGILPTLDNEEQIWQLRCAFLDFARVALSSFNEDLVIFANRTSLNVDEAISTSSLVTYVKLHPFARVIEWMFNDGVVDQLFAAAHANPDMLSGSDPDSPMVTSVARALQVFDLILRLQPTYFDVVRPVIKTQAAARSKQVANPTLASFEDAILTHLDLVVDLGLYCSTAFEHLTTLSLQLLQRLAQSRKLAGPVAVFHDGHPHPSRLLAALQQADEVDLITASFIAPLQIDPREIELGTDTPGFSIKVAILDLLIKSLETSPARPALAHCLLGFLCTDRTISIPAEGRFSKGNSLFHAIARFYAETASPDPPLPSLAIIRGKACEILRRLYKSSLTSEIILSELRDSGFNEVVSITQTPVLATTPPELLEDAINFLTNEPSTIFKDSIAEKAAYFEHLALEIRSATSMQSMTLRDKTRSSALGLTLLTSGQEVPHTNIFDLFDFYDRQLVREPPLPPLYYFSGMDFTICLREDTAGIVTTDTRSAKEMMLLKIADLRQQGALGPSDIPFEDNEHLRACHAEADTILSSFEAQNQFVHICDTQQSACNAWVQLVSVLVAEGGLEGVQKATFIVKALEVVVPKIVFAGDGSTPFLPLVRLLHILTKHATVSASPVPPESLSSAFRAALVCITLLDNSAPTLLRETAYQIAALVLDNSTGPLARSTRKAIESAGDRLFETATDDVLATAPSLRVAALVFLSSTVSLFSAQKSPAVIRLLSRLNFITTLVDNIRAVPATFGESRQRSELHDLLRLTQANLALLLRIAKDPEGATKVLEAGIFSAIRDSGLFSADPELGGELVEGDEALETFYTLLSSVLRVIATVVTVKGERNEGVAAAGRQFLVESRGCFLGVLKGARREGLGKGLEKVLEEVQEGFEIVCWGTGFLEFDQNPTKAARGRMGLAFT
ncbi:nucleoporin Nup186/Nup192/Nup205 [Elsinoe ampelina]|uniref:Nucleoporin Nup186/Nup192/Nup205 n=1 Tax=Elsinoe ampelina TaxID=302913 RepID=A0A6A6GJN3_9PEZI|nr:nucleoporin Nup186/Nup192/Nup205 [Elsinoe ampelina]